MEITSASWGYSSFSFLRILRLCAATQLSLPLHVSQLQFCSVGRIGASPLPLQGNHQRIGSFFRRKISSSLSRRFLRDSSAQSTSLAGLTSGGDKSDRLLVAARVSCQSLQFLRLNLSQGFSRFGFTRGHRPGDVRGPSEGLPESGGRSIRGLHFNRARIVDQVRSN